MQELTAQNKTIAQTSNLAGYQQGLNQGRQEEQQRAHERAGEPYQAEISTLRQKVKQTLILYQQELTARQQSERQNRTLNFQVNQLQEQLSTAQTAHQKQISALTADLQTKDQQNQTLTHQLTQTTEQLDHQKTFINRQRRQINNLQKFNRTLLTAIHECKPLIKNAWSKILEHIGHRFDQAQITDLSLFEQQWPQSDLRTLRQQIAPIPTTTQIRQNSLQELNDLDDDQGFDR